MPPHSLFFYIWIAHKVYPSLPLVDLQRVQIIAFLNLGLDLSDDGGEVMVILPYNTSVTAPLIGLRAGMHTSSGLVCSALGRSWCWTDSCRWSETCFYTAPITYITSHAYLESSADAEDAIVGLLLWETLESLLDDLALFRDQVIIPAGNHCQYVSLALRALAMGLRHRQCVGCGPQLWHGRRTSGPVVGIPRHCPTMQRRVSMPSSAMAA